MYYLIKKNQKKLMAVFAVLLMISFVATIGVGRAGGGGTRSDVVIGHLGKTAIHDSQLRASRDEWAWLSRYHFRSRFGQPTNLPAMLIAQGITGGAGRVPLQIEFAAGTVGDRAAQEIDQHPEAFLLLKLEAIANGLSVSSDVANSFLKNQMDMNVSSDGSNALETQAVEDAMLIGKQLEHLKDAVKISQPVWQHDAAGMQSVRLNLIDFLAPDFQKNVPAPTTQQVQEQFDRFKDVAPKSTGPSNPLGFGYQIPAAVKLQYLEIPRSEVVQAVIHTVHPNLPGSDPTISSDDSQYDWTVQAGFYYNAHKDEFKNEPLAKTEPSTRTSETRPGDTRPGDTQPTTTTSPTAAATTAQAATLPAIKPFEEVKQQIIDKLAASEADKLSQKIADDLKALLASDYQVIRRANPPTIGPIAPQAATQPADASATSRPTNDLMMLAHLEQLRDQIQQKDHVAIKLNDQARDWQTVTDLAKLPGIGTATSADHSAFAGMAIAAAQPPEASKSSPLQVWQPSDPLTDGQQNTYLFRLTAARPAHAPPDMSPIAKQVAADWKLSQAYGQSMQAAQKALASAKSVGLSQAARTNGQTLISTQLFSPRQDREVPGYPLPDPAASEAVLKGASDLLAHATPADKRPDTLVPLPSALRVVVMELAAVQLPDAEWMAQYQVTEAQQIAQVMRLAREWFNYDQIVSRTGYKAGQKS